MAEPGAPSAQEQEDRTGKVVHHVRNNRRGDAARVPPSETKHQSDAQQEDHPHRLQVKYGEDSGGNDHREPWRDATLGDRTECEPSETDLFDDGGAHSNRQREQQQDQLVS